MARKVEQNAQNSTVPVPNSALLACPANQWLAQVVRQGLRDPGTVEPAGGQFALNEAYDVAVFFDEARVSV